MSEEQKEFIPGREAVDVKILLQRLINEMIEDKSFFSEDTIHLLEKSQQGTQLSKEEEATFNSMRETWWQEKYGFPFAQKAVRNETLRRKYDQGQISEERELQEKLLKAYTNRDEKAVEILKQEYFQEYPDQLEGVEALFGFSKTLALRKQLAEGHFRFKEKRKVFQNLTEYNFLLTDFIRQNKIDRIFLKKFWEVCETIANTHGQMKDFLYLKRGIVNQVAAFAILEEIGVKPRLSHPSEDAFNAIDLWTDTGVAVQVKTDREAEEPVLIETDTLAFPGIEFSAPSSSETNEKTIFHINSSALYEARRFQAKLSEYESIRHKKIKGYLIVIPSRHVDPITGKPSRELVEKIREQLGMLHQEFSTGSLQSAA